jgi:hypothetical protein
MRIWNRRGIARSLLVLGICSLGLAGWIAISSNLYATSEREVTAVRIATADGMKSIGWWRVKYSNQLREGEKGQIEVTYKADKRAWQELSTLPTQFVVKVRPPEGVQVFPEHELSKDFSKELTRQGNDWDLDVNYIWTFSTKDQNTHPIVYPIVLEFLVAPPIFKSFPVSVNTKDVTDLGPNDYLLPVKVVSQHIIDPELKELCSEILGALGFLLALPWMKLVVERLLSTRPPSVIGRRRTRSR